VENYWSAEYLNLFLHSRYLNIAKVAFLLKLETNIFKKMININYDCVFSNKLINKIIEDNSKATEIDSDLIEFMQIDYQIALIIAWKITVNIHSRETFTCSPLTLCFRYGSEHCHALILKETF